MIKIGEIVMDTKYMDKICELDELERFNITKLKSMSYEQIASIISVHIDPNIKLRHLYHHSDIDFNIEIVVTWEIEGNYYTSRGNTLKEVIKDIQTKYEEITPHDPLIPIAQIMESIVGQLKETNFTIKNIEGLKSYFHGINHMNNLIIEKFEKELTKNE